MAFRMARGWKPLSLLSLAVLAACGGSDDDEAFTYKADIRRTTMGVPHIKADNWGGAGYGMGFAQAEDNLCTLADAFLTYRGERSKHFGAQAIAVYGSTIDRPRNLDSDFFHRHVISDDVIARMQAAQPESMRDLVRGFVSGYNRYVRDAQSGKAGAAVHAACRTATWVQPITEQDLWRRLYAANLAGGYSNFVAAIANASPPAQVVAAAPRSRAATQMARLDPASVRAPSLQVGGTHGIGSNMYGFGLDATGTDSPVLFGNPHWYWKGPDRFYQAQITIPGQVNVSGVSFLGVPVILIGFNDNVAWSHTVSTARRFGFFQLSLDAASPTRYMVDGQSVPMQAVPITVDVRQESGAITQVQRTLYKSKYGPIVNLAGMNPALGWSSSSAFAIRDINGENFRTFRNWLGWNQAKSLDEFIQIQKRESAIPWVNTVAVGRGSAQAWYADIGAVPNVTDAQLATCTTPVGQAMASALPNVPILDGSRSACQWSSDPDSAQEGAIGPSRMPSLLRADYVGNMNDSYWLSNPNAPLTGYPSIFGSAGTSAQSLRTRLGHTMALERLAGADGYPGNKATSEIVRQMVLNSRVYSAERFKEPILNMLCASPTITLTSGATVDIQAACSTLRAWNNAGTTEARGTHLWDEFWSRVNVPAAQLYQVPFNAADPLNTPRGIQVTAGPALAQAFGAAVQAVQASGFAVDATRGEVLFATRNGVKLPLYGGCGGVGYFTITCSERTLAQGGYSMDEQPHGNSYMQVVSFPAGKVDAYTFLTFSLSDDPASANYGDYTQAYSQRQWLKVPFSEGEISADPKLRTTTVKE